jgi:hypothetical protein
MKNLLVICLGVLMVCSPAFGTSKSSESFSLADHVGEPNARTFFIFSTEAGKYVIRQDGFGEFTSPKGMRRAFKLKLGAKGRIDRVYFLEHDNDVFLLYEIHDATSEWAYLVRLEQTKRKARWLTAVTSAGEAPIIQGDLVIIKGMEISKQNGSVVRQD